MSQIDKPTPFFLLDKAKFRQCVSEIQAAIKDWWPNTIVGYSVKTNSLPAFVQMFLREGMWVETVSEDEYEMVSLCGCPGDKIVCNGPIKSREYVYRLLNANSLLNIDSHKELDYVCDYVREHPASNVKVGLRVNLDVSSLNPESMGGRFGFCYENGELGKSIDKLKAGAVHVAGLHLHTGVLSGTLEKYKFLISKFKEIVDAYNLSGIEYIDLGGGFYGWMQEKPSWQDYFKCIAKELAGHGYSSDNLRLIVEPGASFFAGMFSYYTRVTDIKTTSSHRFAFCDGSRTHIDPLMHKNNYVYQVIRSPKSGTEKSNLPQILVGFTCMEGDRIMDMSKEKTLQEGDIVVFHKVGSYTSTLSPLFISYFPAVYALEENGDITVLRSKWTAQEFVQKCSM